MFMISNSTIVTSDKSILNNTLASDQNCCEIEILAISKPYAYRCYNNTENGYQFGQQCTIREFFYSIYLHEAIATL